MRSVIRRPQVCELTGLSSASTYRKERNGEFPQRVRLGANSVGWYRDEVLTWLKKLQRGGINPPVAANAARRKT